MLLDKEAIVPDLHVDKLQYDFAIDDLKNATSSPQIDWIIVMFHKSFYSSPSVRTQEYIMTEKYQPIFDKYNVDLVLQAHNHIYERTFPLKINLNDIKSPIIDKSNPNNHTYVNPNGTIYTIVGTGGEKPYRISDPSGHIAKQYSAVAGFLNIEFKDKELQATFYDIALDCIEKESDKPDNVVYDLESCKPRQNSIPLKIVDQYTISKNN